jgi:hypothetical protein
MNESGFCIWGPIALLVLWVMFSTMVGGGRTRQQDDRRYDIERRQDGTLTTTEGESWSQITARNAAKEDVVRARKPRQLLLRGRYPGLLEEPPVEVVDGEVVDDVPQLGSGAPQLSSGRRPQLTSGDDYAIQKKRQMRGW